MEPTTVATAALKPLAGLGTSLARSRTWAIQTAWEALKGQPSPKPRRALARWLKRPDVAEGVVLAPRVTQEAVADLDAALSRASRKWRDLPPDERLQRARSVADKAHCAVLSVRAQDWGIRIASARSTADALALQGDVRDVGASVQAVNDRLGADVSEADRLRFASRLPLLPALLHVQLRGAWEEAPAATFALVRCLTEPDTAPMNAVQEWAGDVPPWLQGQPATLLVLAGELASCYDAPTAARALFLEAVRTGSPNQHYWIARAALVDLSTGDAAAAGTVLASVGTPSQSPEPLMRTLDAVLAQSWVTARQSLAQWQPRDPTGWSLWWSLQHAVNFTGSGARTVNRVMLDETLKNAERALTESERLGFVSSGLLLATAQFLIMRAGVGAADRPAVDLHRAEQLALRARDERRRWRGDSGEALGWACEAAVTSGNFRRAAILGSTGSGEATETETRHPVVRKHTIVSLFALGELTERPDLSDLPAFDRHRLLGLMASTPPRSDSRNAEARGREDALPHWRAALAAATEDAQRVTALAALANAGELDEQFVARIEAELPEIGAHLRAMADIACGRHEEAIRRLRGPALTSVTAAASLGEAYAAAGRVEDAVVALRQAGQRFHDPDFSFQAARVLLRAREETEAEQLIGELLSTAPSDWVGRPEALRIASQLALDTGDRAKATDLLRSSLELDPHDVRARWALARLHLAAGRDAQARQIITDHPGQLQTLSPEHAETWMQAHRSAMSFEDLAPGVLDLTRRFADDEGVVALALALLFTSSSGREEALDDSASQEQVLPAGLLAEVHAVQEAFFARWPESRYLQQMRMDLEDPAAVWDQLTSMVAVDDTTARARREMHRKVARSAFPLGVLQVTARRSYAELLLRRGLGTLPAWHPDPSEHQQCKREAAAALDGLVTADTSTLVVLGLLNTRLREQLLSFFSVVAVTTSTLLDAQRGRDELAPRGTTSITYDDRIGQARLVDGSSEQAERLAAEAQKLVDLAALLPSRPDPTGPSPTEPDVDEDDVGTDGTDANDRLERLRGPWWTACRAALEDGVLWSDDAALRVLARSMGAQAFSTAALLDVLTERSELTNIAHDEALEQLVLERVGGIPLSPTALLRLAEQEPQNATGVAYAMANPALWRTHDQAMSALDAVLPQIIAHRPEQLPTWAYLSATGIAHSQDDPHVSDAIAGAVLALMVSGTASRASATPELLHAVRQGLVDAALDPSITPDPLAPAVRILYAALAQILPAALAAQYVFAVFGQLKEDDRASVRRIVLST